ncbi:hypothetical protein ACS78_08250 [Priestia megaterium]|uniref:glycosyl hydrolase family 28-related protein n=1 Tax=Priestia megaterium TaxID=1404 RepID=UPI000682BE63|nr:glycosyl hydrolase family 28-related protein [Priestia megaterium]KNH23933.1 hypothetical protein ACS78_08250 [Priestia megaterium]
MPYTEKLPEWQNPGQEPPNTRKNSGWSPQDRPPAEWLNFHQHRTYKALDELQKNAVHQEIVGNPNQLGNSPQQLSKTLLDRGLNIKDFGAIGDGVTDDAQKIIDAATYAKANDLALYLPKGVYYCSKDVVIDGVKRIVFDGTIQMKTGSTLDIKYNSNVAPVNWRITNVSNGLLRLSGLNSSKIEVIKAKELQLYANGDDPTKEYIAYNIFILGKIDTFSLFSEGTKAGWINENKFFGGRMINVTMDGNFNHDNNIFYGPMLENVKININKGNSNLFYDVRLEGTNVITFGTDASNNVIYRSWQGNPYSFLRDTVALPIVNNGFNNQVVSTLDTTHKKEIIFNIDSKSQNFDLGIVTKNEKDLTLSGVYGSVLYETDLIELNYPMGLILKSDKSLFLVDVFAYDQNKDLILTQQTDFVTFSGGTVFNSTTGAYTFQGSPNIGATATGAPLFPRGSIKYIKYRVRQGTSVAGQTFSYLRVMKIESNLSPTPIKMSNKFKRWTKTSIPTTGYFEKGDIVWNEGSDNTIAFWRRLTTGSTHVLDVDWKAHG